MRKTPLARKVSLRDSYLRKLKSNGTRYAWKRSGKVVRKKPLKKQSRSMRERLKQYFALRNEFLSRPENRFCAICRARFESGEDVMVQYSSEVHHRASRGKNLCNVDTFVSSCRSCRLWPHENPKRARELGLLI